MKSIEISLLGLFSYSLLSPTFALGQFPLEQSNKNLTSRAPINRNISSENSNDRESPSQNVSASAIESGSGGKVSLVKSPSLSDLRVSYDDGINFRFDPAEFSLKMKFRVQNRYSFEDFDSDGSSADTSEFLTRRVRLRLEGTVLDPKLTYRFQFGFSRQDMDWDGSNFPNVLRDANIGYELTERDQFILGLAKLPSNRQRLISSGRQEFVDRSIANALLTIDRDVGLQWWHRFGDTHPVWLKTAISNGQGRGSSQRDNGMALTSKLEWFPLGNFKDDGDMFEGDLVFEETAKLAIAAGYSKNYKATRVNGQLGLDINGAPRDLQTFIGDLLIKYRGWAWSSEYFRRAAESPEVTATQTLFDGEGWNTQLSHTFRSMYLVGVRWSEIRPDENVAVYFAEEDQYTVVFGRYLNKHNIKIQADVSYQPSYRLSTDTTLDNWVYRVQLELGI